MSRPHAAPQSASEFGLSGTQVARVRMAALGWFAKHQRELPWRKNRSLYRVWVSEIMLQQTQVATVIPYFNRFMKRFPNVGKLAAADEAVVLRQWEGLGYYRRARQLHQAAQIIQQHHGGRCPDNFDDWLALPGIGRYTASAILSISSDQRLPILEANTIRLYCRLMSSSEDPRSAAMQRRLWAFAESLVPRTRTGDFNQALMEIGSQVCLPRNPHCPQCPLRPECAAATLGTVNRIPRRAPKIKFTHVTQHAVLICRHDECLLRKCGAGQHWDGLWDVPRFEGAKNISQSKLAEHIYEQTGLRIRFGPENFMVRHGVTRFKFEVRCQRATCVKGRLPKHATAPWAWVPFKSLGELPLNITARRIIQRFSVEKTPRIREARAGQSP